MLRPHTKPGSRKPGFLDPPVITPWRGKPKSDFALLTLASGKVGNELLQVSGPGLRRYAERYGLDFHALRGDPGPFPIGRKWELVKFFPSYSRVIMIDADVVLHPDCPNLLDLVPAGTVGIHNDTPWLPQVEWLWAEYEELCRSQGYAREWPQSCWNTGVWVADREHAGIFGPPERPYRLRHCAEQNLIGLRLWRSQAKITPLAVEFNTQWWFNHRLDYSPDVMVWHWAGQTQHAERVREMREMVARLK